MRVVLPVPARCLPAPVSGSAGPAHNEGVTVDRGVPGWWWRIAVTPRVAAGLAAADLLLAAVSAGLSITNSHGWQDLWTHFAFAELLVAVIFTVVGGAVAVRVPRHPVGWLFLAAGGLAAVSLVAGQYATYAGPGRAATAAAWLGSWAWFLMFLPVALILLVFPDGRLRWAWTHWLAWAWCAFTAVGALSLALSDARFTDGIPEWYRNPIAVPGGAGVYSVVQAVTAVPVLAAAFALGLRWWWPRGKERREIAVFAIAGVVALVIEIASVPLGLAPVGLMIAWPLIAVTTGVVVLRRRLYGVDTLVSRAVVGATLTGFVVLTYLGLVTVLGALVGGGTVTAVIATAVIAFAFHPVQRAVQTGVHHLVYGARPAPRQVLSAFARRAGTVTDDETILADLAALAADGLGAAAASISLRVGDQLRPPPLDGPVVSVDDDGEQVGTISLKLRPGAEPTTDDEALLADLAALAGPVLRAIRLRTALSERNTELAASRARLATAATGERRRLERDLHDGAQQRLIAIKIQLGRAARASRRAVNGDRTAATEAADTVDATLRDADLAINELRDLVHGIYPVALDAEGLAAALRAQARAAPLPVSIHDDLPPGLRYPRDIEAAAYFCCLEAIQNATKHASADRIDVHLAGDPTRLVFAVTDDGIGFTPDGNHDGHGLIDLTDRAAALGGRVRVTSSRGAGATVSGWLPSP